MNNKSIEDMDKPVPIIGDGAIASPDMAHGRLIPVLILDCSEHSKLLNLIHIHEHTPPGDVVSKWGYKRFNSRIVFLVLNFTSPSEVQVVLSFDLQKQHTVVDAIVQSRGVYLQPVESGKKVLTGLGQSKILVEIPSSTELQDWDKRLLKQIVKRLRSDGLNKKTAQQVAIKHLNTMREISKLQTS